MSVGTPIQWTDDAVNPVMGCSAPCELRPTRRKALECTQEFFSRAPLSLNPVGAARLIDEFLAGRNATEIYQLRDHTVETVLHGAAESLAEEKRIKDAYKAVLDEIYICYAHQQTMMRGSDVTDPYKYTNKGYPVQFEVLTKFPERMAKFAMLPDLYGRTRAEKPWLNYLPRVIFVSDMADALSEEIDFEYLKTEIIDVVSSLRGQQHLWLWLTKMPKRMAAFSVWLKATHNLDWPAHLVAMTSVTSKKTVIRAEHLLEVPAKFRALSVEPLWSDVTLPLAGIDWCIVGGQSGPGSKAFDLGWIKNLQEQCQASGTAFFVKQLGALPVYEGQPIELADKHGGNWNEWPAKFRIRDLPTGFRMLGASTIRRATSDGDAIAVGSEDCHRPTPKQMPHRIQWSMRTKNPPGAIYVGRPPGYKKTGKIGFGNPFTVDEYGQDEAIRRYEEWIEQPEQKALLDGAKTKLRGKNLGCWCRPGLRCHADVLLRLVNQA